jgi:hypothetical protein
MFEGDRHDERAPSVGARSVRAAARLAPVAESPAPPTVETGEPDLDALLSSLARLDGTAADDAARITQLGALERVKAACAAAQARITAEFVESQAQAARRWRQRASECSRTGDFDGWAAARDQARLAEFEEPREFDVGRHRSGRARISPGSGVSAQVGLARRESPARAGRIVGVSLALVRHLPHTHAALTRGVLSERRAEIVARGTSHLTPELREAVDRDVIGAHRDTCGAWGDRELERRVRACGIRLDAQAAVERARVAGTERRVTIRPIPDTMAVVSAVLPVAQAVAVHAALMCAAAQAKASGDPRSQGQVMADTLTERVTGQSAAEGLHVEVQLVMTDRTLLQSEDTPAHIPGYGPVPAAWARDLLGPRSHSKVWLRRLFTHPATGTLVAMESKRRLFPPALRRYLVARDGVCRTPWCDAPIRHADHVKPWAEGGSTTDSNGEGLCVTCNLAKEHPGWRHSLEPPSPRTTTSSHDPHTVRITTPTGHTYTSVAPPVLPGVVEPPRPGGAHGPPSPLEAELTARLAG